ncbi:uncharacterized protein LOC103306211 [Chrysemys picta bellii]|uniref:uncharacterized protein LOC103306211 n=1 Tax=Chrysemys picta bellii TaxID=8478 RepID=UPI0032B2B059
MTRGKPFADGRMKRLKQMLRRKAGEVAPEPAGSSVRLAQEEKGPSVPAGREEACGLANRRSSLTCWRKRKTPAPLADPEAPSGPKRRWPRVMLCRRDPGEGGSRARWLCGFLYRKQRSQRPSPSNRQEPSTTLATEEPPAGPEQELGHSGTGARSSTYSRGASSPSVGSDSSEGEGSLFAETPSAQLEEEEEEDLSPEQDIRRIIQGHLQGRTELLEDRAKQLRFLHAVPRLCFLAQQQGRDTLEPHISKAALVESIARLWVCRA